MSAEPRALFVAEPPTQYLVFPPLVVDCSTLAGVLFHEHWQLQATERLQDKSLHAPYLLQVEIASVAAKKHKQGAPDVAANGLLRYAEMGIELHDIDPPGALALALRYQLSVYDACYLWLADELKAPLATFDEKLAKAATAHLASLS